jgi:hypothetical protein
MPQFEFEEWIERVLTVVVPTFEPPQPKSWLAGLGRIRKAKYKFEKRYRFSN